MGQVIETVFADRLEEFYGLLAYHYARAEAWEKAQDYLMKAADQAGRVAADAEALAHYRQAMAAYERAFGYRWDPLQRAALERKMGEAFFRRGDHRQAAEYFQRALALLGRPLPTSRWGIRRAIAIEAGRQITHRLLPSVFLKPPGGPVSAEVEEQYHVLRSMSWMDAVAHQERYLLSSLMIVNISERTGYLPGLVKGSSRVGPFLDLIPVYWLAEIYHRRAVALAEQAQDPDLLGSVYSSMRFHTWIWDIAIANCQRGAEACREAGNLRGWAYMIWAVALALTYLGDFTQALAQAQELTRTAHDGGDRQLSRLGLEAQGRAQNSIGHWEDAILVLKESIEIAREVPDYHTNLEALGHLGQAYLRRGDLDQAFITLHEGQRLSRKQRFANAIYAISLLNGTAEAHLLAAERQLPRRQKASRWRRQNGPAATP